LQSSDRAKGVRIGSWWAVHGPNLQPTGYEPPALIFGDLGMVAKYELEQPVPKAAAQHQPVVTACRDSAMRGLDPNEGEGAVSLPKK
jgi:hypothetical protein